MSSRPHWQDPGALAAPAGRRAEESWPVLSQGLAPSCWPGGRGRGCALWGVLHDVPPRHPAACAGTCSRHPPGMFGNGRRPHLAQLAGQPLLLRLVPLHQPGQPLTACPAWMQPWPGPEQRQVGELGSAVVSVGTSNSLRSRRGQQARRRVEANGLQDGAASLCPAGLRDLVTVAPGGRGPLALGQAAVRHRRLGAIGLIQ